MAVPKFGGVGAGPTGNVIRWLLDVAVEPKQACEPKQAWLHFGSAVNGPKLIDGKFGRDSNVKINGSWPA